MLSHQDMEYFVKVSEHAPIEKNMDILFDGLRIGDLECSALFRKCAEKTGTKVMNWKLIRRWQRAYYLARYFDYALGLSGARVECGVFQGFSALILLEVARMRDPRFSGDGVHLVDSFAGLSEPTEGDAIETRVLPDAKASSPSAIPPAIWRPPSDRSRPPWPIFPA